MTLEDVHYKNIGTFHEIQVGSFSVVGRFPVLVLSHLKDILEKSGRPLFFNSPKSVQVFLEDAALDLRNYSVAMNKTLILDPFIDSHKNLAATYEGEISWFCTQSIPYPDYQGIYFNRPKQELIYVKENEHENYQLPEATIVTRELAASICAIRELGVDPGEIRSALTASPSPFRINYIT